MRTSFSRLTGLCLLLACGCNSGNSSAGATIAPPAFAQADIAIDPSNALKAAQAGVRGSLDLLRLTYIGASFLQTFIPEPPTGGTAEPVGLGGSTVLRTLISLEVAGPDGGAATFTWDDVDQDDNYSTGDVFTMSFVDYADERMVLNGVMTIDDLRVQGLLPGNGTFIVDATLNLVGLSVQIGALQQTLSTQLPFRIDNRLIVEIFDLFLFESQTLGALEIQKNTRLIRQKSENEVRYILDGSVHSAELEGLLRFDTGYLTHSPFLNDPTEGSLFVHGANRSMIEITPNCFQPGLCFSLDVLLDADGDSEYEETLSTNWQGLLPQ